MATDAPTDLVHSYHGWSFYFDGDGPIVLDLDFYANNVVIGGSNVACPEACREADGTYDGNEMRIFLHSFEYSGGARVWVGLHEVEGTIAADGLSFAGSYNYVDRTCARGKGTASASRPAGDQQ